MVTFTKLDHLVGYVAISAEGTWGETALGNIAFTGHEWVFVPAPGVRLYMEEMDEILSFVRCLDFSAMLGASH